MTFQRGKYDASCEAVLLALQAKGIILIVAEGHKGNGLSVSSLDPAFHAKVPAMLRITADLIEKQPARN